MHLLQRLTLILDVRAKKIRDQLVFHLLNPRAVGMAEKETDHSVLEHAIDKPINNFSYLALSAQLFEQALRLCLFHTLNELLSHQI